MGTGSSRWPGERDKSEIIESNTVTQLLVKVTQQSITHSQPDATGSAGTDSGRSGDLYTQFPLVQPTICHLPDAKSDVQLLFQPSGCRRSLLALVTGASAIRRLQLPGPGIRDTALPVSAPIKIHCSRFVDLRRTTISQIPTATELSEHNMPTHAIGLWGPPSRASRTADAHRLRFRLLCCFSLRTQIWNRPLATKSLE
jgi:hypothetical protein